MSYNYDLLLEYLSIKKFGKWTDFKKYVNDLNYEDDPFISPRSIRRMLSALGHVEFIFNELNEYIVAPTVISILPNSTKGVLCGYRTKKIKNDLQDKCQTLSFDYIERNNHNAPKTIFVDFKSKDNINICLNDLNKLEIPIVEDFSKKLLYAFPYFDEIIKNAKKVNYELNPEEKYETVGHVHDFVINTSPRDHYVYSKKISFRNKYYVYDASVDSYKEVDKYIAICNQYKHYANNILKLKGNNLIIKYMEGLPELIDRALTLASGFNRKSEYKSIIYDNINIELANLLVEKSGLKLEVINE